MTEAELVAAMEALRARQQRFMEEAHAIKAETIRIAEASEALHLAAEAAAHDRRAAMRLAS